MEISELIGRTFKSVTNCANETLRFSGDASYEFYHDQDCCECVEITDITGHLPDLEGEPLTMAEAIVEAGDQGDSSTWTFYKFATKKGYVTVRWLGESNGYYSETVDFKKVENSV